jgi:hypothetical protein
VPILFCGTVCQFVSLGIFINVGLDYVRYTAYISVRFYFTRILIKKIYSLANEAARKGFVSSILKRLSTCNLGVSPHIVEGRQLIILPFHSQTFKTLFKKYY